MKAKVAENEVGQSKNTDNCDGGLYNKNTPPKS
jgi:hypothetical protein